MQMMPVTVTIPSVWTLCSCRFLLRTEGGREGVCPGAQDGQCSGEHSRDNEERVGTLVLFSRL